ncbi:hypothetical protein NP493_149g03028 [Ridgeia piscesae]|uniref:Uncharacterized protein n=1 Tax=Ridgeia piscesae TaxID=27915 RepID=A0AAD9P4F4_RIDPI|nr:hypothetical protein NP493_149g03028 [Ridgeia piscesae]
MARWRRQSVLCCVTIAVFCTLLQGGSTDEIGHYTNDFVVEIDGDMAVADLVASTTGFSVEKQLTSVGDGVFHFVHSGVSSRSKRSADDLLARLLANPSVRRAEQQRELTRVKREIIYDKQKELPIRTYEDKSVYQRFKAPNIVRKDNIPNPKDSQNHIKFNDQYFPDQWYLVNTGQSGGPVGYDINVESAWRKGFTGKGVVVTILDDGIDHTHPDLALNYDPLASGDLNDKNDPLNDPTPDKTKPTNAHGTRCAGEVAAIANNSNCCVGVAYEAKIGGVRMLDGKVTDMLEAQALLYHNQHVDIYSASWGPKDDGKTMEGPGTYVKRALQKGVTEVSQTERG